MDLKLLLYKALIGPHFDYCSTVLFNTTQEKLQQLQTIHNRALRIILHCNRYTPIRLMLSTLNLMNVKQRILFNVMDFMYRIKFKIVPQYLYTEFTFVNCVNPYNIRNNSDFRPQTCKLSITLNSIFVKGMKYFNDLPCDIKNCTDYKKFKSNCKHFVINNHY